MRVIVDNKIPFIKEAIEKIADSVIYTPGRDFTPEYTYPHPLQQGIAGRQ